MFSSKADPSAINTTLASPDRRSPPTQGADRQTHSEPAKNEGELLERKRVVGIIQCLPCPQLPVSRRRNFS
ncbi:hypothetical protein TNCV_3702411 [Trichonephila clavipes]|nr:hypothetical protein TNCV_3702411 [Trichonephila clavipes]